MVKNRKYLGPLLVFLGISSFIVGLYWIFVDVSKGKDLPLWIFDPFQVMMQYGFEIGTTDKSKYVRIQGPLLFDFSFIMVAIGIILSKTLANFDKRIGPAVHIVGKILGWIMIIWISIFLLYCFWLVFKNI